MRQALKNINKPTVPVSRRVKVVKKTGTNKYQVVDVYGRYYTVYSATNWKPETSVMIQNGEIIRATGKIEQPTVYKG